ncbi:hypothetical protein ACIBEJ_00385 [Nonomuraea sp. NPDC050790]|uniref:hypothetical protein n=1 Tax=Nonomuraea sp. NPDC050790 TaxID=3364371 RepID=UPI0037964F9C
MRRPTVSKAAALTTAALAVLVLGGTTAYHLLQPAAAPAAPVRELYSCHTPSHRVDRASVCIGTEQGTGVEFVVTGTDDPRLLDGTHDVSWASEAASPCGELLELARPYLNTVTKALQERAADSDAPVDAQLRHAGAAMSRSGVVIALASCRASGLNEGQVATSMVNLLAGAAAVPPENAAATAASLHDAAVLLTS